MQIKNWFSIIALVLLCHATYGQSTWQLVEETYIKGSISGTIDQGYLFKIGTRNFYVVNERTRQRVRTRNPSVKVFRRGSEYKLEIQDFSEPVICEKLNNVIETQIDGDFDGWEGETIFKMRNGQIWQQASHAYNHHNAYSPDVFIYEFKGAWIMRVDEVDEVIEVRKLDKAVGETPIGTDEAIETKIVGEFKGWNGETIFNMLNGQVWQQASYASMYHYAYSPGVIIYKSGSTWKMKVEGVEGTIEVKRVK